MASSTVLAPEKCRCRGTRGAFADYVLKRLCGFWRNPYTPQEPAALLEAGKQNDKAPDLHAFTKVDLGEGILLDESTLTRLRRDAKNSGSRFAQGLLKVLFSSEELENKSLFGRRSNPHKGAAQKEALDPRRVNAILRYTARHFDATTGEIKKHIVIHASAWILKSF
ncbi:uncharacterized protein [Dermacentor albipictus]|uniref:uncharacterized protein n=1 Tax=Dermacentor albipictus TaxID=60249 RepID=UPI0038FC2260